MVSLLYYTILLYYIIELLLVLFASKIESDVIILIDLML